MNQKLARRAQNQSLSGMGESLGQEDISGSGVNQDIIFPAVILSGLDALTTEDSVLNILGSLTKLPMKSVRIGRDPLTNMSRGVCYVEMNSVVDSKFLHNQLIADPPLIDGRQVQVSCATGCHKHQPEPGCCQLGHGGSSVDQQVKQSGEEGF